MVKRGQKTPKSGIFGFLGPFGTPMPAILMLFSSKSGSKTGQKTGPKRLESFFGKKHQKMRKMPIYGAF